MFDHALHLENLSHKCNINVAFRYILGTTLYLAERRGEHTAVGYVQIGFRKEVATGLTDLDL